MAIPAKKTPHFKTSETPAEIATGQKPKTRKGLLCPHLRGMGGVVDNTKYLKPPVPGASPSGASELVAPIPQIPPDKVRVGDVV